MKITLLRFSYAPTETEGRLELPDLILCTMERPWIPNPEGPGGVPFRSCVPEGIYRLEPWTRPDNSQVYILSNPDLGVYRTPDERGGRIGRDLILIHVGNWVNNVVGCIAPGLERGILYNSAVGKSALAVLGSGRAMQKLREVLGDETHELEIRWIYKES